MTRYDLRNALGNANLQAFLRVIRAGEGTSDEDGYRRIFGGELFDSFADHPRVRVPFGSTYSTAAGAYQFLARTWDGLVKQYRFQDFSPACQDEAAVALIVGRRALPAVLAGRLEEAIRLCNREWASLPGSPYGQPTRTMDQARKTFAEAGGAEVGRSDQEDKQMVPLLIPLAGALIEAFRPLAAEKLQGVLSKHTDNPQIAEQVTTALIDTAKAVTGQSDPIAAVAAVKADPEKMRRVEDAVVDQLSALAPALDRLAAIEERERQATEASRDAAAERAKGESWDMTKPLIYGLGAVLAALMLLVGAITLIQVFKTGEVSSEVWAQVVGLIGLVGGVGGTVYAYRFGSSVSSRAKDVLLGGLVDGRGK
jgi:muramidase (phage lysozyme)